MRKIILGIMTLAVLSMGTGCTKKREARMAPGQGEDLDQVSAYQGKVFSLDTLDRITYKGANGKSKELENNSSGAQNSKIKLSKINADSSLYPVHFQTEAKLPDSTLFVGKPNASGIYEIHYKLTNSHLILYKVAKESYIPLQERTYKTKDVTNDGRLAIPLIGYPITGKYIIEKQKNDLGEDTSLLREKTVSQISQATHLRIDFTQPKSFEAITKTDFIPAELFEGEPNYYFSETIIATPESGATLIGSDSSSISEQNLQPSTRIKFVLTRDALEAVDMNLDERLQKSDLNFKKVLIIPYDRKGFKVSDNGLKESEDDSIHWSDKKFLSLKFDSIVRGTTAQELSGLMDRKKDSDSTVTVNVNVNSGSQSRVNEIEIDDDYFSFTVTKVDTNVRIRYSFLRVQPSQYKPKIHFESDWNKFGYFTTTKSQVQNYEIYRKDDLQKNQLISRFNPKLNPETGKREIVFNVSVSTPAYLRDAASDTIEEWNKAFKKAGTNIEVRVDRNKDSSTGKWNYKEVEVGDLRYNVINLIETLSPSNLFGYGPSLTDPYTGEIISATTNVHVTPIRSAIISEIRNFILLKRGYLTGNNIENKISGLSLLEGLLDIAANSSANETADINFNSNSKDSLLEKNKALKQKIKAASDKQMALVKYGHIDFRKRQKNFGREFDLAITSGNIHESIQNECPDLVTFAENKNSESNHDQELNLIESCSMKLLIPKMQGTLVHELGHNFGLRHNFYGSNDVENFYPISETETDGTSNTKLNRQVRSSSVMEYPDFNEDRLSKPGLYDIAAIRYGYADSVMLADSSILKLNTQKTIEENISSAKGTLKKFKFCTDDHIFYGNDPMCARHDAGTTPSEVVTHIINSYDTLSSIHNYRLDRAKKPTEQYIAWQREYFVFAPLYKFYTEWRVLLAQLLGEPSKFLDGLTAAEIDAKIQILAKTNKEGSEKLLEYQKARNIILTFMRKVAMAPSRYCVVRNTNKNNAIDLVSLEALREDLYFRTEISANSCSDHRIVGMLKEKGLTLETKENTLTPEIGFFLNSVQFDQGADKNSDSNTGSYDIIGMSIDRILAFKFMSSRLIFGDDGVMNWQGLKMGLFPNMLDEPDFRSEMSDILVSRLISGVNALHWDNTLAPYLNDEELKKLHSGELTFAKYSQEKAMLFDQIAAFLEGLSVEESIEATQQRIEPFSGVLISPDPTWKEKSILSVEIPGGYINVLNPSANMSIALASQLRFIYNVRISKKINIDSIKDVILSVEQNLPTEEEFQNMTFKDLMDRMRNVNKAIVEFKSNPALTSEAAGNLDILVSSLYELNLMNDFTKEIISKISKEPTTDAEKEQAKIFKANLGAIMATPAKDQFQELAQGAPFKLFKGFASERMNARNNAIEDYQKNKTDYDAQAELILRMLTGSR